MSDSVEHATGHLSASPGRRADALENRRRILEAARTELASSDDLRLHAVARRAGVGQATLYRHFSTREALLGEIYRQEVEELAREAPVLLARYEPVEALARWLDRIATYAQVKRGVFDAVEASVRQELAAHSHGTIGAAMTTLLDAGKAAGRIRSDVDARDVILLIGYLSRIEADEWDARAHHLLTVVLDGLRASARGRSDVTMV